MARAQQIVERWRENLHTLWDEQTKSRDLKISDKVLHQLQRAHPHGLTPRDITQKIRDANTKDIREALILLQQSGLVGSAQNGNNKVEYHII
jgi:Fe2+ or Zn2+ uptake regulation protein